MPTDCLRRRRSTTTLRMGATRTSHNISIICHLTFNHLASRKVIHRDLWPHTGLKMPKWQVQRLQLKLTIHTFWHQIVRLRAAGAKGLLNFPVTVLKKIKTDMLCLQAPCLEGNQVLVRSMIPISLTYSLNLKGWLLSKWPTMAHLIGLCRRPWATRLCFMNHNRRITETTIPEKWGLTTLKIESKIIHNLKWNGRHSIESTTEFKVLKRGLYMTRIMQHHTRQPKVCNSLKVCSLPYLPVAHEPWVVWTRCNHIAHQWWTRNLPKLFNHQSRTMQFQSKIAK